MSLTLSEAQEKWEVSRDTLCVWLERGFIPEVELENKVVKVGETKPCVPKKNTNINVKSVRKYILKACNQFEYIDSHILGIPEEQFKAILLQLEDNKYIQRNLPNVDCTSNEHFIITEEGEKFMNKGKFKLEELGFTIDFKYLNVSAKIKED